MPSTIVKLCSSDARAWAHNQPLWIRQDGSIERPVTRAEEHAISTALNRTKNEMRNFRLELTLHEVQRARASFGGNRAGNGQSILRSNGPVPKMQCAFEVSLVGKKRTVTVWCGELRYGTSRESLRARLLAEHGECLLHGRNGKAMGVLRDPLVQSRARNRGRTVQFSRNPSDPPRGTRVAPQQQHQSNRARGSSQRPVVSPPNCPNDCRGLRGGGEWALAKGARPPTDQEHHPICMFAPAWAETLEGVTTDAVLYDLELSTVARAAMPNEMAEADEAEKRTGIRQVVVAGRLFAVLPAGEATQAAAEARGETVDSAIAIDFPEAERADESTELVSTDLGDADDGPDENAPPPTNSNSKDRNDWPDLDARDAPEAYRQRAEVTAQTYLARSPGNPGVRA